MDSIPPFTRLFGAVLVLHFVLYSTAVALARVKIGKIWHAPRLFWLRCLTVTVTSALAWIVFPFFLFPDFVFLLAAGIALQLTPSRAAMIYVIELVSMSIVYRLAAIPHFGIFPAVIIN